MPIDVACRSAPRPQAPVIRTAVPRTQTSAGNNASIAAVAIVATASNAEPIRDGWSVTRATGVDFTALLSPRCRMRSIGRMAERPALEPP
jgi:hypothetical protein